VKLAPAEVETEVEIEQSTDRASLLVHVNGHHASWPAKFAASGPRDAEVRRSPYRMANTSISLIVRAGERVLAHILVDAGMGVMNSLLDLQESRGLDAVHALVLTHPHFDHVAGLDWLLASLSRSTVAGQPWPLPVFCTPPAYDALFTEPRLFHWWRRSVLHRPVQPGAPQLLWQQEGARLTVSSVLVEHGPSAPGATIYAFDFYSNNALNNASSSTAGEEHRRVGVAWDMLRLQPDADAAPIHDCDVLFVDSTTVHPQPDPRSPRGHRNWHISVEESMILTAAWRPRRTYLIHYSGSHDEDPAPHDCIVPDVQRALTSYELAQLAARLGDRFDRDLRVAGHGLCIPEHHPWPGE